MSLQIKLSATQVASLTCVLLLGFSASLGMAFNIDAIVLSFNASNTTAGLVASLEMASIAAGNLTFAKLSTRLPAKRVYLGALITIVTLNVVAALVPSTNWLMVCRIPAGFALGAVVATVMMTAGRSDKPEQTFGLINAMVGVMGMFMAFVLPRALGMHTMLPPLTAWSEVDGLYLVYALCSLCALPFIAGTPETQPIHVDTSGAPPPRLLVGWLGLVGLGIIFFGHATLALFIVKIGRNTGLTAETIGYVFMAGSLAGIGLPLLSGYIGSRMKATIPIGSVLVVLMIAAILLANAATPMQFFVAGPLFAMLPIAIVPIFLGCLSRVDPTGSLAGAHAAFVLIGSAIAPFAGGALSDIGGFTLSGWFVVGCVLLGAGMTFPVIRRSDAIRDSRVQVGESVPGPA